MSAAYMASIAVSALGMILNAAAMMWIIVAGIFMLVDDTTVALFRPWVIVSVIYIVIAVTFLAWRASPRKMTIILEHKTTPQLHYAGQAMPRLLGMEMARPNPIHWVQADGGVFFAEADNYALSVAQADGIWIWTLARGGVITADGVADSFAEAERLATIALFTHRPD